MAATPRTRLEGPCGDGDAATAAAVAALGELVRAHHYDTVQRIHCFELAPRWLDASVRQTLASCPQPTRDLVRLFFLGESLAASRVEQVCGAGLAASLAAAGVLDAGPDVTVARYRLEVVGDHLLLAEW